MGNAMLLKTTSKIQCFCQTASKHVGSGGPTDWVSKAGWRGRGFPQKCLESGWNLLVLKFLLPLHQDTGSESVGLGGQTKCACTLC